MPNAPTITAPPSSSSSVQGTQAAKSPQLHKIITDVLGGTTRRILFVGDSRCSGAISIGGPCSAGWFLDLPALLAPLLGNINVQRGLVIPVSVADTRWTLGAPWAYQPGGNKIGWAPGESAAPTGGAYYTGNAAAGTLSFSSFGINTDTYDVYYFIGTGGLSAISANFNGGANTVLPVNGGPVSIGKTSVSGGASAAASCNIVLTAGGIAGSGVLGVEPRLSTAGQLLLGQAGVNGGSALAWNTAASTAQYGSVPIINKYAPDMIVWELGIDDALIDFDSITTFLANLDALILATVGYANSIILGAANVNPTVITNAGITVDSYITALKAYASSKGIPYIDQYGSWGGINAYPTLNPYGLYNVDGLHMSAAGYNDQARYIAQALAGLIGTM